VHKTPVFDDIKNEMAVFSSDDDRLKFLGEIFGTALAETILSLVIEQHQTWK